jgi:hypothetical protein
VCIASLNKRRVYRLAACISKFCADVAVELALLRQNLDPGEFCHREIESVCRRRRRNLRSASGSHDNRIPERWSLQ